jgi:ectoine hydroxylase-related dioxygenase (phytanoyl-CoA dioxygenase family)
MRTTLTGIDLKELKDNYERDGFAVARELFSPEEVEEIKETFAQIHRNEFSKAHDDGVRDPNDPLFQYPRIVHPHRFNAVARRYMLHAGVRACLRVLFGEEPVATQTMYYFKPPGARGQAMHQDNLYLLVDPGTCLAAWTAIDRVDRENGGMMLVPGSHRGNLLCQEETDMTVSFSNKITRIPQGLKAVDVPMEAGDTLFFGGSTIHGSGPNRLIKYQSFTCRSLKWMGPITRSAPVRGAAPAARIGSARLTRFTAKAGADAGARGDRLGAFYFRKRRTDPRQARDDRLLNEGSC